MTMRGKQEKRHLPGLRGQEPGTDTPLGSRGGVVAMIHGGTPARAGGATPARTQCRKWRCLNFFLIMYKDGTFSTTPA